VTNVADRLREALASRYVIQQEVGRGGMAIVYLAEDVKHHRRVAVKVLLPELAAVLGPDRFLREIEIAAQLTHPHILPLYDSGEADGFLYYVMPYIEGESLRDKLNRENQISIDEALNITTKVARALDHAHQQGIIHRDIKPENILLHDGEPLVADFGIALAVTEAGGTRLTETGLSLGTPSYMSPEQATGDRALDARTDIYSLASVLYEMLAGDPPFSGSNVRAVIAKVVGEKPTSIRTIRDTVPPHIETAIAKALAKVPADRFASAGEFATAATTIPVSEERPDRLTTPPPGIMGAPVGTRFSHARVVAAAVVLLLAVGAGWLYQRGAKARWARDVAIPEIMRLRDENNRYDALHLAIEAERYIPNDVQLQRLKLSSAFAISVRTTPDGADVYYADYLDTAGTDWRYLGQAPLDSAFVPATVRHLRWRVEKPGFETALGTFVPWGMDTLRLTLHAAGSAPVGVVRIPGGMAQISGSEAVELAPYWLDTYEVTNEAFLRFVETGGYQMREYWQDALVADGQGRNQSWQELVTQFTDRTGRPGPATWELGSFPSDEATFPVRGVSWYEAAAYCRFAGKDLPTVHHWRRAADFGIFSDILLLSNFGGVAPVAVEKLQGLGSFGTYGMAGNVKEWAWNATGTNRYILGGAWNEPDYRFHDLDAQPPAQRLPSFGLRCAKYDQPVPAGLLAAIDETGGDFADVRPVSDEIFRIYADLYDYDPTPLNVRTESIDESAPRWREEVVTYDAAYGNERIIARLYVPKGGSPPYQTIVYFPSSSAQNLPSSNNLAELSLVDFIPRTGRALLYPVYQGTYERRSSAPVGGPNALRDRTIQWGKDVRRSIDYLETRDDIDLERLAFMGLSMGAVHGPIFTAIEDRFAVSVLLLGGLSVWDAPPEVDPIHFAPRSTIPTLMVNGRNDFQLPVETSQRPLFRLLGTPDEDKRHVILEGGHAPFDFSELIKETLNWLDRYLGPVN
jgi:eukaryotic-like serine/threonine-protein kinase